MANEDTFATPSAKRDFELVVEGESLFVNRLWLAERSPFFAKLFEREAENMRAELSNHKHADILELMRVIALPAERRKFVTDENLVLMLRLSHDFELIGLQGDCFNLIRKLIVVKEDRSDPRCLDPLFVQLLKVSSACGLADVERLLVTGVARRIPTDKLVQLTAGVISTDVLVAVLAQKSEMLEKTVRTFVRDARGMKRRIDELEDELEACVLMVNGARVR